MAYRVISIPGNTTRYEACPQIIVTGGGNSSLSITVIYHSAETTPGGEPILGKLTFHGVLEFRWTEFDVHYDEYSQHEQDYEFGLIDIIDSKYIENMRSRQPVILETGQPTPILPGVALHHFRMGFDDWGELNIIATDLSIQGASDAAP